MAEPKAGQFELDNDKVIKNVYEYLDKDSPDLITLLISVKMLLKINGVFDIHKLDETTNDYANKLLDDFSKVVSDNKNGGVDHED